MEFKPGIKEKSAESSYLIRCDLKRMLKAPGIYLPVILSLFILLRPLAGAFTEKADGTFLQILSVPFASSDFTPFAAIFCVLPFAGSFCEDYNSGYIKAIASRIGVKKYARQRCLSVLLSGGIMMALTVMIVIVVCACLTNMPETEETSAFMRTTIWARMGILTRYHEVLFVTLKVLLAFLFGAVWALIGLTISVFITNRYITYIAPFVLYQILWLLLEGSAFNPVYMLRGDSNFIPSFPFILFYQAAIMILCFMISCMGIRKKVEET